MLQIDSIAWSEIIVFPKEQETADGIKKKTVGSRKWVGGGGAQGVNCGRWVHRVLISSKSSE